MPSENSLADGLLTGASVQVSIERVHVQSGIRKALIALGVLATLLLAYKAYSSHGHEVHLINLRTEAEVTTWLRYSGPKFVHLEETSVTTWDLLKSGELGDAGFVVLVDPEVVPQRRTQDQPWVTAEDDMLPTALLDFLNVAAQRMEGLLGRQLYSFHLRRHDFSSIPTTLNQQQMHSKAAESMPYVVWDASNGTVYICNEVANVWKLPHIQSIMQHLADAFLNGLTGTLRQAKESVEGSIVTSAGGIWNYVGPVAVAAVPAAFAMVAPPLWFCVLCPAVLGLFFPLLWNIVLEKTAAMLCTTMKLEDDQCFDLLLGALALAFVLSLASAIPIVFVCKMSECAHRDDNSTSTSLKKPFRRSLSLTREQATK